MFRGVVRVEIDVCCLDGELAPHRHRVARVDREVQHDLLDLTRIGHDAAELSPRQERELDVLAHQAAEHALHPPDERVEVDHLRLEDLLPAEREELAGERARPLGGVVDLHEVCAQRVALCDVRDGKARVAQDHRQQVVEVVRDAAREPADGLELLRLRELRLEQLLTGHVAYRRHDDDPLVDHHALGRDLDDENAAGPGAVVTHHGADRPLGEHLAPRDIRRRPLFGHDDLLETHGQKLVARVSVGRDRRLVDVEKAARRTVEEPLGDGAVAKEKAVSLGGGARLGDVGCARVDEAVVGRVAAVPLQPPVAAVFASVAVLEVDGVDPIEDALGLALGFGAVVRVDEVDPRARHQLLVGPPERLLPRRIEALESAVFAGDAQERERHREEPLDLPLERLAFGEVAQVHDEGADVGGFQEVLRAHLEPPHGSIAAAHANVDCRRGRRLREDGVN